MNNDGLYKVRLFLINIGKILPFVICFVVLISYAECLASILTNNYLAYNGAIVLNKPVSWALGLVFEYNVQLLFVVTILAFAIHTCITNKLAIAYLYVNLYEKHYFISTELSEESAMIVAIINFLICLYFVHKGFDIYIYNKKEQVKMTRKEFIQKWVCDNINNGATANELIAFAVEKADEIEKCDPSFFDDSFKIAKLYQELDTIPINAITFSKGQFKTRFIGACHVAKIETIGDLVRYGYSRFLQLRNIGRDTIREAEDSLGVTIISIGHENATTLESYHQRKEQSKLAYARTYWLV